MGTSREDAVTMVPSSEDANSFFEHLVRALVARQFPKRTTKFSSVAKIRTHTMSVSDVRDTWPQIHRHELFNEVLSVAQREELNSVDVLFAPMNVDGVMVSGLVVAPTKIGSRPEQTIEDALHTQKSLALFGSVRRFGRVPEAQLLQTELDFYEEAQRTSVLLPELNINRYKIAPQAAKIFHASVAQHLGVDESRVSYLLPPGKEVRTQERQLSMRPGTLLHPSAVAGGIVVAPQPAFHVISAVLRLPEEGRVALADYVIPAKYAHLSDAEALSASVARVHVQYTDGKPILPVGRGLGDNVADICL